MSVIDTLYKLHADEAAAEFAASRTSGDYSKQTWRSLLYAVVHRHHQTAVAIHNSLLTNGNYDDVAKSIWQEYNTDPDGVDEWVGRGVWDGWRITTNHAASSYGHPVLVMPDGTALGPGDIIAGPLVGLSDAAEILGWDRRKVATYIKRGNLPKPIQRLRSGPIWTRQQIEEYRDTRTTPTSE